MLKKTLCLACLFVLAACGFRAAGTVEQGKIAVGTWTVIGGVLQQPLERELRRRGLEVEEAFGEAELRVLTVGRHREVDLVNLSGSANAYLLRMTVDAQADRGGKPWGGVMRVSVQRRLDYRDSEIHGKHSEEQIVWSELERDAAEQLVRRLGYLKAE